MGTWSRGLLAQTRLIMDAQENPDPLLQDLLEDLELVLVQLVGAGAIDGVWSIAVGCAAEISREEKRTVEIQELLNATDPLLVE